MIIYVNEDNDVRIQLYFDDHTGRYFYDLEKHKCHDWDFISTTYDLAIKEAWVKHYKLNEVTEE